MATGVLLSGNAIANVKPVPREAAARSTKPVASNYPNLKRFARNLTQQARLGKLQAVSGYDAEIAHVVKTLSDSSRTPVLVVNQTLIVPPSLKVWQSGSPQAMYPLPCVVNTFSVSVLMRCGQR